MQLREQTLVFCRVAIFALFACLDTVLRRLMCVPTANLCVMCRCFMVTSYVFLCGFFMVLRNLAKFRHLLEAHDLTRQIFDTINGHLVAEGLMLRDEALVDATLIAAPLSTKNQDKQHDPKMHQSKRNND